MKNKEIEELLNKAKDIAKYGVDGKQHTRMFNQFEAKALLSYIEQLQTTVKDCKQKLDQYENPEDLTLFYMWLDTIAKDKMKQMETEILKLKQQNSMITKLGEQLENNRDKAIEYIKNHKETREHYEPYGTPMGDPNYTTTHIFGYYELLDILKGDSDYE